VHETAAVTQEHGNGRPEVPAVHDVSSVLLAIVGHDRTPGEEPREVTVVEPRAREMLFRYRSVPQRHRRAILGGEPRVRSVTRERPVDVVQPPGVQRDTKRVSVGQPDSVLFPQLQDCFDGAVNGPAARPDLGDRDAWLQQGRALRQLDGGIAVRPAGSAVDLAEPQPGLEGAGVRGQPSVTQVSGRDPALSSPAGVQGLGHGPEVGSDSRAHRGTQGQDPGGALTVAPEQASRGRGRPEDAERGRRVEAEFVVMRVDGARDGHLDVASDHEGLDDLGPLRPLGLADREHDGHQHGTEMPGQDDGGRVVEVLGVRGHAVAERREGGGTATASQDRAGAAGRHRAAVGGDDAADLAPGTLDGHAQRVDEPGGGRFH
jgi:hypothetical protein